MKSIFYIKKTNASVLMSLAIVALLSVFYVYAFMDLLESGETEGMGFIGIIESDTFLYRDIFLNSNILVYLEARVKNFIMPTVIWALLDGNWYMAVIFNIALLYCTVIYIKKIAGHIQINIDNKILIFVVFLPETFIYLIGVLKEIPTLFLFTALTFYFLKKRWITFLVLLILLAIFRWQFVLCIGLFLLGQKVFKRNNIRFLVLLLISLSAIYPLLVANVPSLGVDDAAIYRELNPGLGIGSIIETIQYHYYGLSFLATAIKLFQMIIAPWPAPDIYDGVDLNVIALAYSISAVFMLPVWFKYFRFLLHAFRHPESLKQEESAMLCISFSFVIMVALNSFVHHRYLYPGIGLVLLVAYTSIRHAKKMLHAEEILHHQSHRVAMQVDEIQARRIMNDPAK